MLIEEEKGQIKSMKGWIAIASILGGIGVLGAFLLPTILKLTLSKTMEELGPVGDFFGGTTVGLLSFASGMFLIVSIMLQKSGVDMQRNEMEMQRKEIAKTNEQLEMQRQEMNKTTQQLELQRKEMEMQREEMAKTTEQLNLQKEEYRVTNETMKKQSFDSIFFQMVSLQNEITKDMILKTNESGKVAIEKLFEKLKDKKINHEIKCIRDTVIVEKNINFDKGGILKLEEQLDRKFKFLKNLKPEHLKKFLENTEDIDNKKFLEISLRGIRIGDKNPDLGEILHISYTNLGMKEHIENVCFNRDSIKKVYEEFYKENVLYIGHYYRNMYRIIKMINSLEVDEITKSNYRGILRAQLSTIELLMLFYNINYSKKGKKFSELLIETDFFDDHLDEITEQFLWENKVKEDLEKYKIKKISISPVF